MGSGRKASGEECAEETGEEQQKGNNRNKRKHKKGEGEEEEEEEEAEQKQRRNMNGREYDNSKDDPRDTENCKEEKTTADEDDAHQIQMHKREHERGNDDA